MGDHIVNYNYIYSYIDKRRMMIVLDNHHRLQRLHRIGQAITGPSRSSAYIFLGHEPPFPDLPDHVLSLAEIGELQSAVLFVEDLPVSKHLRLTRRDHPFRIYDIDHEL